MSEYYENKEKEKKMDVFTRSVHRDYQNGTNDVELAADILSEGLDQPDWHLKYARNIINLVLFIVGGVLLSNLLFGFHHRSLGDIDPTLKILTLLIVICIASICGFFDNVLDQESTEVRWFNYARFWFVVIPLVSLTIYIAIMAIGTIASF